MKFYMLRLVDDWLPNAVRNMGANGGRRLAIVAGSSVLGGVSERISQTRKTRR
jgi:hypothetical protein